MARAPTSASSAELSELASRTVATPACTRYDGTTFTLDAEYRHAFAQTRVPSAAATDDPAAVATDAYDLVNVSLGYSFTAVGRLNSLTLRADNLFDTQYREASSRIKTFAFNPGRNVALVYRLLF